MSKPRKPTIDERIQAIVQGLEFLASQRRAEKENQEPDLLTLHQLAFAARQTCASIEALERTTTARDHRT